MEAKPPETRHGRLSWVRTGASKNLYLARPIRIQDRNSVIDLFVGGEISNRTFSLEVRYEILLVGGENLLVGGEASSDAAREDVQQLVHHRQVLHNPPDSNLVGNRPDPG